MGDVNHEADSIHLGDDLPAEGRETVPFPTLVLAGVRIGELAMAVVRQRHVARAAIKKLLDSADVLAHGVAVLDTNERDSLALRLDSAHVGRGQRQLDLVGRDLLGEPVDRVELLDGRPVGALVARRFECIRILRLRGLADVNAEEHRGEAALEHLGQVHLSIEALGVVPLGGEIRYRDIAVRVERDDALVDGARLLDERFFGE